MRKAILAGCWVVASIGYGQTGAPISGEERLKWMAGRTLGPGGLFAGALTAGFGTLGNQPEEYGPHWAGFGKRYGIRMTQVGTATLMESGLGAIWGEDPRYVKSGGPVRQRMKSIVKQTFLVRRRDGEWHPAYARYAAISGANFISNTWRADSEASAGDAGIRIAVGFGGQMISNAFAEFGGEAFRWLRRKKP